MVVHVESTGEIIANCHQTPLSIWSFEGRSGDETKEGLTSMTAHIKGLLQNKRHTLSKQTKEIQ